MDSGATGARAQVERHSEFGEQLQQLAEVLTRACQTGHLDAQYQPDMPQGDLADQALEARPRYRAGPGPAQVIVDHQHPARLPAQRDSPVDQRVLQPRGLTVIKNLPAGGLTHVHDRECVAMPPGHLPVQPLPRHQHRHEAGPSSLGTARSPAAGVVSAGRARPTSAASRYSAACRFTGGSAAHTRSSARRGTGIWGSCPLRRP